MSSAAVSSNSYINKTQEHTFTVYRTSGIAGRDFNVLTLIAKRDWFERWIFPTEFMKAISDPSKATEIEIGRIVRFSMIECASIKTICSKDPVCSGLDVDRVYKVTQVFNDSNFVPSLSKQTLSYSSISLIECGKYHLHLRSGDTSAIFELEEKPRIKPYQDNPIDHLFPKPERKKVRSYALRKLEQLLNPFASKL